LFIAEKAADEVTFCKLASLDNLEDLDNLPEIEVVLQFQPEKPIVVNSETRQLGTQA
jgi:hypothetical protein